MYRRYDGVAQRITLAQYNCDGTNSFYNFNSADNDLYFAWDYFGYTGFCGYNLAAEPTGPGDLTRVNPNNDYLCPYPREDNAADRLGQTGPPARPSIQVVWSGPGAGLTWGDLKFIKIYRYRAPAG